MIIIKFVFRVGRVVRFAAVITPLSKISNRDGGGNSGVGGGPLEGYTSTRRVQVRARRDRWRQHNGIPNADEIFLLWCCAFSSRNNSLIFFFFLRPFMYTCFISADKIQTSSNPLHYTLPPSYRRRLLLYYYISFHTLRESVLGKDPATSDGP